MSFTMVLGRVILPAAGLILAAAITWHSVRTITARCRRRSRQAAIDREGRVAAHGSRPRAESSPIPAPE